MPPKRSGLSTVAMLGVMWIAFAYSPFGMRVLHGAAKSPEEAAQRMQRSASIQTPIAASQYLKEHPPVGLSFNTYEWGDYLLWDGPPGAKWFLASHAHLVPREVWEDYFRISAAGADWENKLDRYGVNTVVLDRNVSPELVKAIKEKTTTWKLEFEDRVSAIFVRRKPV